ncbi:NAD(P)-dependent oxidoreductase [Flavobacterium sp. LPB0248]|uniref:NAD-dependent epimerase/dehydratase family protein n=1 Tax=Flavobacterium sp. LPB0248 TaxID=2614441 RepID=UPI0015A5F25C|nr:NAD(P)-dependent oxidoreductase [Flavobacterium sp. LPB0248]QLC67480.1 NAD(P)-dependent oxidoreductase [Flavobacterium sp. LPB0248]
MVGKKVLVTGGSGYIGARLCLHLASEGYLVTALCHSKLPQDENWISKMEHVLIGDIRDEVFLQDLAQNNFDIVIHLVSLDHKQSNGIPSFVGSVNIIPVWSMLDIFSKHGLKKFIYFSTAQVYGSLLDEIVREDYRLVTQNAYGLTHHIGEVICEYYNRSSTVDCRIIRLSNSYGAPVFSENNCWWLVVNDLCSMAFAKKEIVLQSDGTQLRDFIHGWDVCNGVQAVIETTMPYVTYNLNSGATFSIMELAKKIKSVYADRYGIELTISAAERKNTDMTVKYVLDNSQILGIGFRPKWSLEDGINELFDYLEQKNE